MEYPNVMNVAQNMPKPSTSNYRIPPKLADYFTVVSQEDQSVCLQCTICQQNVKTTYGVTSNLHRHLKRRHGIDVNPDRILRQSSRGLWTGNTDWSPYNAGSFVAGPAIPMPVTFGQDLHLDFLSQPQDPSQSQSSNGRLQAAIGQIPGMLIVMIWSVLPSGDATKSCVFPRPM